MERLTERRGAQWVIPLRQDGKKKWALCEAGMSLDDSTKYLYGDHANLLAAYEDTGLEPEEIKEHEAAYIEIMTRTYGPLKQKISQLLQAEKDGRLVVLPCKVGDTVWTNIAIVGDRYKAADRPYPVEVVFIGMGKDEGFFHVQYSSGRVFPFDFDKVGKTVFLTCEEAEAALKKREEADDETG